ncbi:hypothetical protein ACFE04_010266 [Oxalis oulophora]
MDLNSIDSSPRSHAADLDELPQVPNAKLRLMCSYDGHIIPRPHDKVLSYIGGETRLVVIDRHHLSFSVLCSRLSKTLVNGRQFTIKYKLPHEELDSLVSISTDEDLENMLEEHDRISASSARIRLFLFFAKPEKATSMGSLLDDAKKETWFVDAINQSGLIQRNLSDSDCLVKNLNEDSPMFESGSTSSTSSSIANLTPIRVRFDQDRTMGGVEEQFGRLTLADNVQKHDDGFGMLAAPPHGVVAAPPPPPPQMLTVAMVDRAGLPIIPSGIGGYSAGINHVLSDDESIPIAPMVPFGFRNAPSPLHTGQIRPPPAAHYNLPFPESVTSESSVASSAKPLPKHSYYQDHTNNFPPGADDIIIVPKSQIQTQDSSGYVLHTNMNYLPHQATTLAVPTSSCYPAYATQPGPLPPQHHAVDQQYVPYIMPVPQTQPYNMAMQPIRPPMPPIPSTVVTPTTYKDVVHPPHPNVYPAKTGGLPPSHMGVTSANQYFGYSHPQSQPMIVPPQAPAASYGYEYPTNPVRDQLYYAQHQAAPLPSQFQHKTPPPPPPPLPIEPKTCTLPTISKQ